MNYVKMEAKAPEGWFSQYDMEILCNEIASLQEGLYLEIGVYKGRSLWAAAQVAKPGVELWGIDELPNPKIPNTNFIRGDSKKVKWNKKIDVLFIDGDHTYEGCKADIEKYAPFVKPGGCILFHDCDETSTGVVWAVAEFCYPSKQWVQFKKVDKNTSMAKVWL